MFPRQPRCLTFSAKTTVSYTVVHKRMSCVSCMCPEGEGCRWQGGGVTYSGLVKQPTYLNRECPFGFDLQLASAMWRICEQTRAACGATLGDVVIAVRQGQMLLGQPGLAVAVAAADSTIALQAIHQIVELAINVQLT